MKVNLFGKFLIATLIACSFLLHLNVISFAEIVSGSMTVSEKFKINDKAISRTITHEAGKDPSIKDIMIDGQLVKDTKLWVSQNYFIDLTDPDLKPKSKWVLYIKPMLIIVVGFSLIGASVALVIRRRSAGNLKEIN